MVENKHKGQLIGGIMSTFKKVEAWLEARTGLSADEIRRMSPEEFSAYLEKGNGKKEPKDLRPTKDTPVDTLLLVWKGNRKPEDWSGNRRYFACMTGTGSKVLCWKDGRTSKTIGGLVGKEYWEHAEILEYPDGSKPGGE